MNDENKIKKPFFQRIKPLLLSHHPNCTKFKDHVFEIGGKKFCIGCFIGFPSMFVSILLLYLIQVYNFVDHRVLLIIGIVLFCTYALKLIKPLNKIKGRIIIRIFIGTGLGFLFWGNFGSSISMFDKIISFLFIFGGLYLAYSTARVVTVHYTCHKCSYDGDWNRCPGFQNNSILNEIERNEKKEESIKI